MGQVNTAEVLDLNRAAPPAPAVRTWPEWEPVVPPDSGGDRRLLERIQALRRRMRPLPGTLLADGQRSQRALAAALGQLVLDGVASPRMLSAAEKMCGPAVTGLDIAEANRRLDEEIEPWRTRSLRGIRGLYLSAMDGTVRRQARPEAASVLLAMGIRPDGRRTTLDAGVRCGRRRTHWQPFLESLRRRGLADIQIVVSEAHDGLPEAIQAVWPEVPWQRCQTELRRRAQERAAPDCSPARMGGWLQWVWEAPDRPEADDRLHEITERVAARHPQLADWLSVHVPQGLALLALPPPVPRRLRTAYLSLALMRDIRRRTRVAAFYPGEDALHRLVCAVLMETSEDWEAGPSYLQISAASAGHGHGLE